MTAPTVRRRQTAGRATGVALAGAVATTAANFGIAIIVAGAGTALAGVFFATTALATILGNSAGLGTMTGQVYFLPRVLASPRPDPRSLLVMALGPVIGAGSVAGLALAATARWLGPAVAGGRGADAAAMLGVLAVAVPFWAVTVPVLGATRGLGSMTPTVVVNQVLRPLGQLAGVTALAATDRLTPLAVALAWTAPVVVAAVAAVAAVTRLGGLASPGPGGDGPDRVTAAEFWSYTRPRSMATAFQIALERSDVVLVSALAGEAAAGVYGALSRYVTAGNFLVFSVAQAVGPELRRHLAADRLDRAGDTLRRATAWMVLLAWPYFLLVATKAGALTGLIDPAVVTGAPALTILAVAMLVNAGAGPIDLTLLMLGRSGTSLAVTAAALAVDLGLGWVLIPTHGAVGAAVAWAAAVVVVNAGASVAVHRASGLVAAARPAGAAAAVATVAVLPVGLITGDDLPGLVATVAVAAVAGAAASAVHLLRSRRRSGRQPGPGRRSQPGRSRGSTRSPASPGRQR